MLSTFKSEAVLIIMKIFCEYIFVFYYHHFEIIYYSCVYLRDLQLAALIFAMTWQT